MATFPKRYVLASCPEYPDAKFRLLVNPSGRLWADLLVGSLADATSAAALGGALVEAYAGGTVEAYDIMFDFSTPEQAIATIKNEDIPADLRFWLRNAPAGIVDEICRDIEKNWRGSLTPGS